MDESDGDGIDDDKREKLTKLTETTCTKLKTIIRARLTKTKWANQTQLKMRYTV